MQGRVGWGWSVLVLVLGLTSAVAARPPNIVFILADDLGYGDIGAFGQKKIGTPHLDALAAEGIRFTQHYSGNAVCAPSRCVLLTGKHPGHAWIRDNREVKPEGQPPLPAGTATIASILKKAGYATCAVGKWGLGYPGSEGDPLKQGFDRFFGYNCQRQAHNFYPTSLWNNSERLMLKNPAFPAHQKLPAGADPHAAESYRRYAGQEYAPDLIHRAAVEFIQTNGTRPFFLYYATTVPHLALQVPDESLAEYRGRWEDPPYTGSNAYLPHRSPRAAYAAMITRLDRDIGDLVATVKRLGLENETVFVFTSDNGPLYNRLGGTDSEFFDSAAGLRGRKGSLYEGGVRVPTIVRWRGKVKAGGTSDRVSGFEDWLPTLAEIAGTKLPNQSDGISLLPTLRGKKQPPRSFLYREFPAYGGWQSVRVGDWKLVRTGLNARGARAHNQSKTELYDLKADQNEQRNVAARHPGVLARLEAIARREHVRSELFPMATLDAGSSPAQR